MGNVVCLTTTRNAVKKEEPDAANEYISTFYDWARAQGIDTTTTEFKFNAATVLTVVQALLHGRN
jgi:hypothetical protein